MANERLSRALGVIGQGLAGLADYNVEKEFRELEAKRQEGFARLQAMLAGQRDEAQRDFQRELFGAEQAAASQREFLAEQRHQEAMDLDRERLDLAKTQQKDTMQLQREQSMRGDLDSIQAQFDDQISALVQRRTELNDMMLKGEALGQEDVVQQQLSQLESQILTLQEQKVDRTFEALKRLRDSGATWLQGMDDTELAMRAGAVPVEQSEKPFAPEGASPALGPAPPGPPPGMKPAREVPMTGAGSEPATQSEPGSSPKRNLFDIEGTGPEGQVMLPDVARAATRGAKNLLGRAKSALDERADSVAVERAKEAVRTGQVPRAYQRQISEVASKSPAELRELGFTDDQITRLKALTRSVVN